MTVPFSLLQLVKGPANPQQGKNNSQWRFHLQSSQERRVDNESIDTKIVLENCVRSHVPGFSHYAHRTTAGWQWMDHLLAYIATSMGKTVLVICPWWRSVPLVMDVETLQPIQAVGADVIQPTIQEVILDGLSEMVTKWETTAVPPKYPWGRDQGEEEGYDPTKWFVPTALAHHAGMFKIEEATPWLWRLEAMDPPMQTSSVCGNFFGRFDAYGVRRAAQIALRRVGLPLVSNEGFHKPISFQMPSQFIKERKPDEYAVMETLAGLSYKSASIRHGMVLDLKRDMSVAELGTTIGIPDYVGRAPFGNFWRYDIDMPAAQESSYSLLVWLSKEGVVQKAVKFSPPLWTIGADKLFAPTEGGRRFGRWGTGSGSLIGSDGDTVYAYCYLLETGSFAGTKETLALLSSSEASGTDTEQL